MMPNLKGGDYVRAHNGAELQNSRDNVVFHYEAVFQPAESAAAGRDIFKDEERYEQSFPGNNLTVITGKVTDFERQRWPAQYEAFKKSGSYAVGMVGTPLEQWPGLSVSMIKELRYLNIITVENLAAVDDNGIARIGAGARRLVERAKAWLAAAEDDQVLSQLASAKADLEDRVAVQDGKIAELTALLGDVTARLQSIQSAGALGVGPGHLANVIGSGHMAPPPAPSALETADLQPFAAPRRGPGRPRKDAAAPAA